MHTVHLNPLHTGCSLCALRSRRLFTGAVMAGAAGWLGAPAWAQDRNQGNSAPSGLQGDVGRESRFTKLVSAEQVEAAATQQYSQMMGEYSQKKAVAPADHPQVIRLRSIAARITPFAPAWNPRAAQWSWQINLLGSPQINAFCMPGGKIAFYMGILAKLQLSDDEVATIMGHEVAHALREHARERMGKGMATQGAIALGAAIFGLGDAGRMAAGLGGQLLSMKFGRDDETEADLVGMDLAARAGYDPAAGVTLWQKMMGANKGAPPQFLSTHPAGATRIKDIQGKLAKVQPLYERAAKPGQRFGPPGVTAKG